MDRLARRGANAARSLVAWVRHPENLKTLVSSVCKGVPPAHPPILAPVPVRASPASQSELLESSLAIEEICAFVLSVNLAEESFELIDRFFTNVFPHFKQ